MVKNPQQRLRDIGDAVAELEEARTAPSAASSSALPVTQATPWGKVLPWVVAGAVMSGIVVGGAVWILTRAEVQPPPKVTRWSVALPSGALLRDSLRNQIAVSPNGTHLAYAGTDGLYLRAMSDIEATLIRETERAVEPAFSPNGQWVAFLADQQLKRVAVTGGAPVVLCDMDEVIVGTTWGPDGNLLLGGFQTGIWRVAEAGGTPELLIPLREGEVGLYRPQLLPDGEWLLFLVNGEQIAVQSLETGERKVLVENGGDVRYLPTGHLAYVRDGVLLAVPFDAQTRTVTDGPVPLVEGVSSSSVNSVAQVAYANDGTLVYQTGGTHSGSERTLVWVDRNGVEEPLDITPRAYSSLQLSPDGRRVVVDTPGGDDELFLIDLETSVEEQFTVDPAVDQFPIWSPDGSRIVFVSNRYDNGRGQPNLYTKPSDGSGIAERLGSSGRVQAPNDWADGGATLIYSEIDIFALRLDVEAEPETIVGSDALETVSVLSPNGRWLAYKAGDDTGLARLYVLPFPVTSSSGRRLITDEPADDPLWGPDGREFFYLTRESAMVVPVNAGDTFERGVAQPMFSMRPYYAGFMYSWDISPDGQRFLMVKRGLDRATVADDVLVVQNWFKELAERVPVP